MRSTEAPKALAVAVAVSLAVTACTSGEPADKAGGAARPTTLRLATEDDPGRPAADHIFEFARHVETLSDGALRVEPVWDANGDEGDDWDQVVARKVVRGEMEMGMVPARAWDTEGVESLRALHAPFLVTSEQAMAQVATGDLAGELLAGLGTVGVTGLALVPEGLRHVVLFREATLSPAALVGKRVRVPRSDTTYALFEALGATPDDFAGGEDAFRDGIASGAVVAAEASFGVVGALPTARAVVGDITLFPKMNSLVINSDVFESLSEEQQDVLRTSARRTVDWAIDHNPSDAEAAAEVCRNGVPIVTAGRDVADQLERSAQAVYRELEQDQTTKELIARLRALRQEAEVGEAAVAPCGGEAATSTAGAGDSAAFPEGVYRMEMTAEVLTAAGVDEPTAYEHAGIWTLSFEDGRFREGECPGTYTADGDRVTVRLADVPEPCGDAAGDVLFSAAWTLEGDQLQFSDVRSGHGSDRLVPALFGSTPFTRID